SHSRRPWCHPGQTKRLRRRQSPACRPVHRLEPVANPVGGATEGLPKTLRLAGMAASGFVRVLPAIAAALAGGRPAVALAGALRAPGLPRPANVELAARGEAAVRAAGAAPATIAVLDGEVRVGLDAAGLRRVCGDPAIAKLSARDVPVAVAGGLSGATTVAGTAVLAVRAGIGVFATGGLGGGPPQGPRAPAPPP